MPNLPLLIARRYLFAKKSHNVINIISAISVAGMAVGTAALIVILSVYNGFDSIVRASLDRSAPDLEIVPSAGKTFVPDGEFLSGLRSREGVLNISQVLAENVYLSYSGRSSIVRAKGVDSTFEAGSPMAEDITDGEFALHKGSVPLAVVAAPLAYSTGINPRFLGGIELYFPRTDRPLNVWDPSASLESIKIWPAGIYKSVSSEDGDRTIILPIEEMRKLLNTEDAVSSLELRFAPEAGAGLKKQTAKAIARELGDSFQVRDRYMQNSSLYRMMRVEKASVYLILIFITIIIAFNIFGSLTMLMIEKEDDMQTLRSLGAEDRTIKRIFVLEGWMVSLAGMAIGLAAGVLIVLLQQKFGFIRLPASFSAGAYPVILRFRDLLMTAAGVAASGYLIALLPSLSRKR